MKLREAVETMLIDKVRTAKGCPEQCLHCGAYNGKWEKSDLKVEELGRDQLEANLTRGITGTRLQVGNLLAKIVTTDVNTEPLHGNAFADLAELVYELTDGKSRVVCISHGLRVGGKKNKPITKMEENLERVVQLVEKGVVPLFVLSVDTARLKGRIDPEINFQSYLATMIRLRPILSLPSDKARLTISIQGDDVETSPLYRGGAEKMFQRVLTELQLTSEERERLQFDRNRAYAKIGRAEEFLPDLGKDGHCPVIPDAEFVRGTVGHNLFRGMVDEKGNVWRQPYRPSRTYNDSVSEGAWELLENPQEEEDEPEADKVGGVAELTGKMADNVGKAITKLKDRLHKHMDGQSEALKSA